MNQQHKTISFVLSPENKELLRRIILGSIRSYRSSHPDEFSSASLEKRLSGQIWGAINNGQFAGLVQPRVTDDA